MIMKPLAFTSILILVFSTTVVFAQGPQGPGPNEGGKGFPREVPAEIVKEGLVPDFVGLMCGMMKFSLVRLTDGMDALVSHFSALDIDPDVGEYITLDLSEVQGLKAQIITARDNLCAATPDNVNERLSAMADLLEGESGVGPAMERVSTQMQTQLESAFGEPGSQSSSDVQAQIQQIVSEIEALNTQVQAEQQKQHPDGSLLQSLAQQIYAKQAQLDALQAQGGQQGGQEGQQAGEEMQAKMLRIQAKLATFGAEMQAAMEDKWNSTDYQAEQTFMFEQQKSFFLKVFTKKMAEAKVQSDALAAAGVDVTALNDFFSQFNTYVTEHTTGANDVFATGNQTQVEAFFTGLDALAAQAEEQLQPIMEKNVKTVFFPQAEEVKTAITAGVQKAKTAGLDTTTIEGLATQLEQHLQDSKTDFDNQDVEAGLEHIKDAQAVYEQIKLEWAELEAAYKLKVAGGA